MSNHSPRTGKLGSYSNALISWGYPRDTRRSFNNVKPSCSYCGDLYSIKKKYYYKFEYKYFLKEFITTHPPTCNPYRIHRIWYSLNEDYGWQKFCNKSKRIKLNNIFFHFSNTVTFSADKVHVKYYFLFFQPQRILRKFWKLEQGINCQTCLWQHF